VKKVDWHRISAICCRAMSAAEPEARSARVHHAIHVVALLVCVWFAVHGTLAAWSANGSDFTIYYDAGRALIEGREPIRVFGFIYLPFFALCMAPLALLPYELAAVVWQAGSFAVLVWITRALVRIVRADGLSAPAWLAWAPLVCVLRLADSNFGNGQVNLFVLGVVLLGIQAWIEHRPRGAGAWIGLAAALKLLPAFLGIVLLVRRSWRACALLAATALACALLVPIVWPGWSTNVAGIQSWWQQESGPYLHGGETLLERRSYLPGQSLTPVIYRLITPMPATSLGNAGPSINVLDMDPEQAKWVVRAAQLVWFAVLVAALIRSRKQDGAGSRLREFSLAICGALTLAPLVHKAHMVWMIVPFACVLAGAPDVMSTPWRRVRWALVAASIALVGLTTPAIFGRALATSALSHNMIFFGLQCLSAALLVDVWRGQGLRTSSA
jgi:hypothetical protein